MAEVSPRTHCARYHRTRCVLRCHRCYMWFRTISFSRLCGRWAQLCTWVVRRAKCLREEIDCTTNIYVACALLVPICTIIIIEEDGWLNLQWFPPAMQWIKSTATCFHVQARVSRALLDGETCYMGSINNIYHIWITRGVLARLYQKISFYSSHCITLGVKHKRHASFPCVSHPINIFISKITWLRTHCVGDLICPVST